MKSKSKRLIKSGWRAGTSQDFLGLSDEEAALIEMKLALAQSLKDRRSAQGLTQDELAKKIGSSQSRIAKQEAADGTVSIDALVRSLLALGATRREIGRVIGRNTATTPV